MHYIMTLIWSVLIAAAVSFVLTSMAAQPFVLSEALVLAAVLFIAAVILGDGILRTDESK